MELFKHEPTGVLVSLDDNPQAGYIYNVWFPYTRSNISQIREGSFIAIKNFEGLNATPKYSILELISVLPVHYALGATSRDTERAFPGFVVEAAKSARQDWEQEEPTEQTTKIRTSAISTNFQITSTGDGYRIEPDESMPMIGEEVFLLTNETTNRIVNRNLVGDAVPHIKPCWLVLNEEIPVCVSTEDLLRTHFGVFGFTGSGKSNLLSTIISKLIETRGLKIVLFDLMFEYSGLLIDLLIRMDDAMILSIDPDSLPGGRQLEAVLRGEQRLAEVAAQNITNTLLIPREIAPSRGLYTSCFIELIRQNKFKIYTPSRGMTPANLLYNDLTENLPARNRLGLNVNPTMEWLSEIELLGESLVNQEHIEVLMNQARDFIHNGMPETFLDLEGETRKDGQTTLGSQAPKASSSERTKLTPSTRSYFLEVLRKLQSYIEPDGDSEYIPESQISMREMLGMLNDERGNVLIVVQSNKDDDLRRFSSNLITNLFNYRKRRGVNSPQVLFIFDEADEFMPGTAPDTYGFSKAAITTIARRGRKFGMGVSIATQRVAYLDTSILAQMHTYLISKLPRQYDRETISNAFGLSEDLLRRTLKFTKGQWLLVSYEALGLENVPLPVQFPNANTRLIEFLSRFN